MGFLTEIGRHLQDQGVAVPGTTLFYAKMPDLPNSAIAIFDTPGMAPVRTFANGAGNVSVEKPRLQVHSRADNYTAAQSAITKVYSALENAGGLTLSGTEHLYIQSLGPPFFWGRDDNEREILMQNYQVTKRRSP